MILPEVTANPWVYIHGVWGAMLTMFCMLFNFWGTAWGTISGARRPLPEGTNHPENWQSLSRLLHLSLPFHTASGMPRNDMVSKA
jgi:hypothetical protein